MFQMDLADTKVNSSYDIGWTVYLFLWYFLCRFTQPTQVHVQWFNSSYFGTEESLHTQPTSSSKCFCIYGKARLPCPAAVSPVVRYTLAYSASRPSGLPKAGRAWPGSAPYLTAARGGSQDPRNRVLYAITCEVGCADTGSGAQTNSATDVACSCPT